MYNVSDIQIIIFPPLHPSGIQFMKNCTKYDEKQWIDLDSIQLMAKILHHLSFSSFYRFIIKKDNMLFLYGKGHLLAKRSV